MTHALVDGSKRVAFFATDVFLRLNGWRIETAADGAHRRLIGLLEGGEADFAHPEAWLRKAVQPV